MVKLKDAVVVVTGASSGIGRATALAFGEAGATVVVSARRREALEEVAGAVRERGGQALVLPADVTDADAVARVAEEAAGTYGRIDVWVNNAAVILYGRTEAVPVEAWHRVIETNVLGVYHGMRAAIPYLREQGSGTIITVGSLLSQVPAPFQSAYVASKHAVRALNDSVRQELLDVDGIAVCSVLPGAIDTPLFDHAANYTGRRPKPPPPVIDADRVAAAIVSCARKPEREVEVGASTSTATLGRKLVPGATERAAAAAMEREQFLDERAEPTDGNLFAPPEGRGVVAGGWKDRDGGRSALKVLATVGAAGAAAAAVSRLRSER